MSLDLSVDGTARVPAAMRRRLRIEVARMVRAAARRDGCADYEVSLRLVDDDAIHALNRRYRHKNKPTDVLAFAQLDSEVVSVQARGIDRILGDIVISVDTARRQARHGLYRELIHLSSHGLCHLLGYDHRDDDEEREMNARAAALRAEAARRGRVRAA
jgi:probable rRNA maturation factor